MKGRTSKPCHGCGKSGRRDADKVCDSCQKLLAEAAAARAALDADVALGNYVLAYQYYSLPYIHHQGYESGSKEFQQAFHRLCQILSAPVTHVWKSNCTPIVEGVKETDKTVSMSVEVRDCLNVVYQSALQINRNAFKAGEREGNSFVLKLAKGDVSIDAYNKATTGK